MTHTDEGLSRWLLAQIAADEAAQAPGRVLYQDGTPVVAEWLDPPTREQIECRAKRALLAELARWPRQLDTRPGRLLRILASVYADRPGYQPAWKPEDNL